MPPPPPPDLNLAAVLLFLRRHGLSHSESALFQDIIDQSHLSQSSHGGGHDATSGCNTNSSSDDDDDDDFVSAVSSIAHSCSSDLPTSNPHGIHMIRLSSPTSSSSRDKLFQFGTALDDVDNDFDGNPSEDKFMMTVQTGEIPPAENLSKYCTDCYAFDSDFALDKCNEKLKQDSQNAGDRFHYSPAESMKVADAKDVQLGHEIRHDFTPKKSRNPSENNDYTFTSNNQVVIAPQQNNLNDEDTATTDDNLSTHPNEYDDYDVFNLRIVHRKNRTGFEENKELPIVLNSVIAGRYYITEFLGSAAFSRVVQAHDLYAGLDVCLKIIKNDKDFFDQSLDEIKLLKYVNKHDPADEHHILRLYDYFYHQEHLFIVTELLRANLYEFQNYTQESGAEPYFTLPRLQLIALQCLNALLYLHDLGIMHCDLKPENILIKSYRRCEIKVIDLGSSCFQTDKLSLYVQSRSYRAPEVMLGLPYDQKIDLWSLGCILAELYSGEVLFPNEAVALLLARMIALLGPVDMDMLEKGEETHKYFTEEYDLYYINEETNEVEYIIPDESSLEHHLQITDSLFIEFLKYLMVINPHKRPTVREALEHPWLSHTYHDI